jgi:hypothetical protein
MRKYLSCVLLLGAIMATALTAQTTPLARQVPADSLGHLEVAVNYNAMRANVITGDTFWIQGGSVQVHGQFWRGLGVVADVAGQHTTNINSSGVALDMVTVTFGPRYTWSPAHSRYSLFGEGLVGDAFAYNGLFPTISGPSTSSSDLAVKTGGGMNLSLSRHVALRAFEALWLRTQLPNTTTNVQNNLQLGAGIVVRVK